MSERSPSRPAGHGPQAFPTTCWSQLQVGGEGANGVSAAYRVLAQRYWRPIVAYARARGAASDDDAVDATQDFFAWMLERGFLARADPARGSFRGFVKRSLVNFLHDRDRRARAARRGGDRVVVPLDTEGLALPDPAGRSPEQLLDDLWRSELLAQATDALAAELETRGRPVVFALFRDWYLGEGDLDHAALAERHGVTRVDVSNHLALAKRLWRAHLRAAVLDTVGDDDELRAELAWLLEGRA